MRLDLQEHYPDEGYLYFWVYGYESGSVLVSGPLIEGFASWWYRPEALANVGDGTFEMSHEGDLLFLGTVQANQFEHTARFMHGVLYEPNTKSVRLLFTERKLSKSSPQLWQWTVQNKRVDRQTLIIHALNLQVR